MANTAPLKFDKPVTFRVDEDFLKALDDLRRAKTPIPSRSEVVRELVMAAAAKRAR
jgi:Arc/MetJ-type ribon-helix-helix transcriptional regulator